MDKLDTLMLNLLETSLLNKKLLLHVCCGPCSTHVINLLKDKFKLVAYWYNPNIHPFEEYLKRLEQAKIVSSFYNIPLIIEDYEKNLWFKKVKNHESDPEGKERCDICFRMRIEKTARYANVHNFDIIATTLTIGPMKNATRINTIGKKISNKYHLKFLDLDFKKKDGFNTAVRISKKLGLYRQNYCGCIFSKNPKTYNTKKQNY